jgi:glycosyltransferase involved in cell wall biosynthesis
MGFDGCNKKNSMKVSVVIPTLNRPARVKELLGSLKGSSVLPDEVCIVEQGDVKALNSVMSDFRKIFNINVIHQAEKSTAVARNTGVKNTSGDITIFLDDDMLIDSDYIAITKKYLKEHPSINGIAGLYNKDEKTWTLKRVIGVFFGVYSWKMRNIVLPSGAYDYIRGQNLDYEQTVEWLPSCNLVLRSRIFNEFQFNDQFKRWSFGEDAMLTYQIHKKYPHTLKYLPNLEVVHNEGKEDKMVPLEVIRMKIIYRYIFWKQEVSKDRTFNTFAFLWSQVGLSVLELMHRPRVDTLKTQCECYAFLYSNRKQITNESSDYNSFVFTNYYL